MPDPTHQPSRHHQENQELTVSDTLTRHAPTRARHPLATALVLLVATDAVGGLWAVAAGVNSWAGAWGGTARLAAPAPMVAAQVLLTVLALRRGGRTAFVSASLLSAACLVSVASGFFDGGLADDRLSAAMSGFQVLLLAVTSLVGVLAAARARQLLRTAPTTPTAPHPGATS